MTTETITQRYASGSNDKKALYKLEPHVCRVCFGRLASTDLGEGLRRFECTNCGASAETKCASSLCCCGIKIRKTGGRGTTQRMIDAGVRCHANPDPNPQSPSLYVASYVGADEALPDS